MIMIKRKKKTMEEKNIEAIARVSWWNRNDKISLWWILAIIGLLCFIVAFISVIFFYELDSETTYTNMVDDSQVILICDNGDCFINGQEVDVEVDSTIQNKWMGIAPFCVGMGCFSVFALVYYIRRQKFIKKYIKTHKVEIMEVKS